MSKPEVGAGSTRKLHFRQEGSTFLVPKFSTLPVTFQSRLSALLILEMTVSSNKVNSQKGQALTKT